MTYENGFAEQSRHKAIVRAAEECRIELVPTPEPRNGEIVVAPEKTSLCGTDIQILRRMRSDPSTIVGHEGAARVMALGAGVHGFDVGDRVVVNPTHPDDPKFLLGHNVHGLFQQRVRIAASAVDSGLITKIPPALSSSRATLIEPWAVTGYALKAMSVQEPDTVLLWGDGLIGNLAALRASQFAPGAQIILVHSSHAGQDWSANVLPRSVLHATKDDWDGACGSRVAVLVATYRDATANIIDHVAETLGRRLVAVHPMSGLEPGDRCHEFPALDPAGVRSCNTGGPTPPTTVTITDRHRTTVAFTGNRGVTTTALHDAAVELASFDRLVDRLVTHDLDMSEGVDVMNRLCFQGQRVQHGRRITRLVLTMNADMVVG